MNFNPEHFDLADIVEEITLLCSDIAEQKSIKLRKEEHSKRLVHADKAMISIIIRNLVSNALKFTHPGGTITISIGEKQGEVTFKIIDTGVGITKSSIEKLFQINEKHSTRGTQDEEGTGLGLILCKEFIDKHDGKIWAESETGKGSTFYFTIPCKDDSTRLN
jgi:signal transduction histidine kinase